MGENLLEALVSEIERVAVVRQEYLDLPNNAGQLGAAFMRASLDAAKTAIGNNDLGGMVAALKDLREVER